MNLNHSCAKGKISNIPQMMGPAPQVLQAEVQVPCQALYQQVGATQSCCPHDQEPSINHLQMQKEAPTSSEAGPYPAAPSKVSSHKYPTTKAAAQR